MKTFDQTEYEQWLAKVPQEIPCETHPEVKRQLHLDWTREHCEHNPQGGNWWRPEYFTCPECKEQKIRKQLLGYGVPLVSAACTLENWEPRNEQERAHLESVRKFADEVKKGFLLLLGSIGTGKTHLATAALRKLRHFQRETEETQDWGYRTTASPLFIKQSSLLRELRATYSDRGAKDPIEKCKAASILVLDEMGLSAGGKDEAPMLHEILDFRYSAMLPTVITSNLPWDELRAELGERLGDRLRESTFKILVFAGPSHRTQCRERYFNERTSRSDPDDSQDWRQSQY